MSRSIPCPKCSVPIDLSTIEWCHCVSKTPSVVCPSCHRCSCNVTVPPLWGELLEDQIAETFRRQFEFNYQLGRVLDPKNVLIAPLDD